MRVPLNVPRLGRGDDEDDRAEVKDEGGGFEKRSRSGCYFPSKTPWPLPPSRRQLGRGVASFSFLSFGFLPISCVFNESIVWAGGRI